MAEPHRVFIDFDCLADGIWWVSPKEEQEAATYEEWRRACKALYGPSGQPPPLRDLLSDQLLHDLKAWNDAHDYGIVQTEELLSQEELEERGRELAVRVQTELGADGWEVLYYLGGRVHRVHRQTAGLRKPGNRTFSATRSPAAEGSRGRGPDPGGSLRKTSSQAVHATLPQPSPDRRAPHEWSYAA